MMSSDDLRPTNNSGRKPLGKLATRLEEVKNPWRQGSTLELSHNETARLATDALLESGEKEYRRVLTVERELNFLSSLEIRYITEHAAKNCSSDNSANGTDRDIGEGDTVSELTSGTYFPMMSDEEPPILELGWPENPHRYGPSETQIYFQRDKSHNVKDLIRSLINKAKKVIALVMDLFTDVDLLCDLMEASNKRKVPVYILLDEKNLNYFVDMCAALDIQNSHLGNMRIRSVCGDTYCTKSGKKFTGQVQEKFLIIDCEEVIAGSYSFSWLSAQVHSNMVMHFSGQITDSFDREFRCLYADSQIIDCFHNPDEEGLPYYPYPVMVPNMLDLFTQRPRDREKFPGSDNSSSQSSSSMSSVKAAPGMTNTVYKVNQGPKKEPSNSHMSPERRGGTLSPTPHNHPPQATRGSHNGNSKTLSSERPSSTEWSKSRSAEFLGPSVVGTTSKFQALGVYDHKSNLFNSSPNTQSPVQETPLSPKQRTSSNPFLTKLTDLFLPPTKKDLLPLTEKDTYNYQKVPFNSTPFAGPDLSQAEPENPPPPPPGINRHEHKRMTLGHSKLDLVNHYNKMKSKQVYSRFELKNNH
ncbi:protein FAM83C [Esox lucius]|uniref:Scaffolding anchor of CK1 domain-containing protein n=1 Tax=Esox lucius TaxID=8010 RepID=A0AAY5KZW1_ESOLU|nr:protein FAM83C [Esox lucius]